MYVWMSERVRWRERERERETERETERGGVLSYLSGPIYFTFPKTGVKIKKEDPKF